MSDMTLKDISAAMKGIDICMMTTSADALVSRPMSNNRDVDYSGDSYFFTNDNTEVVRDIESRKIVNLAFVHTPAILGKSLYISVSGKGDIVRDRAEMQKHWVKDLDVWFKDGINTPGLAMIHVKADSVKYWHGWDEGEVKL